MTNSHEWIDRIIAKLFEAEDKFTDRMISQLNRSNCEIKRQNFRGFIHMGKRYIPSEYRFNLRTIARQQLPTLDFTLMSESEKLTKLATRVELDKSQIKQVLFELLHQCNNLQEIRDVLPECLVPLVPELANVNRFIQDPLYMMRSHKMFLRDFERILPKIEFYAMSHMIY